MRLAEKLAAMVENAHCGARGGLFGIGDIRAKDPGMSGLQAVGAFAGNAHFGLRGVWFQLYMVAD